MPIQRKGRFLVTHDLGVFPSVGVESEVLLESVTEAGSYEGVFGSPFFNFKEDNLDFLAQLEHLHQVWFWDCTFSSIDGLYSLDKLEYCGVMDKHPGIDYSRFPNLKKVVSHWNKKDSGIERSPITSFNLWHYKPRSKSFAETSFPPKVEKLELNWVNPSSLKGISVMPELKELVICRSRNMTDLSLLPSIAPNLQKLIVTDSKRLEDFNGVKDHPSLKLAIIRGERIRG